MGNSICFWSQDLRQHSDQIVFLSLFNVYGYKGAFGPKCLNSILQICRDVLEETFFYQVKYLMHTAVLS